MSTSAIISLIFTIGFWILFLYVVIRARKKRKARQAEATAQTGISKTFFGRAISSLGRFFSLLFLAAVGMSMIIGTVGLIVSDNKTDEVAETGQETATTEIKSEAKTYYVKSRAANIRECPSTSCKVINTLPQNTELTFPGDLFDKYPDWAEITFPNGQIGYVSKTTLSENTILESQLTPTDDSSSTGGITIGPWSNLQMTLGDSYEFHFCEPPSAISGATCGALADETTDPKGGTPPYSFIKKSGFLPPGITLELNGTLKGAPTQEGTYNFRLCAKDLYGGEGCQNLAVVVKEEATLPINGGTIGTADLDMTIDSITCILAYQDDYDRLVFNVSMSGTATGPVGTYLSFWSSPPDDERYRVAEPYSILAGIHAEVNSGSWTEKYRDRTYSNKRAKGDPATTSWKIRGQTVHFYNASVQNSTMTRVNVSIRDESAVPTNEIKIFKDVTCSL